MFGLEQKFFIDTIALENGYKNAQKVLHPDMFSTKSNLERDASNETSSTVNQAYQVTNTAEQSLYKIFSIDDDHKLLLRECADSELPS